VPLLLWIVSTEPRRLTTWGVLAISIAQRPTTTAMPIAREISWSLPGFCW